MRNNHLKIVSGAGPLKSLLNAFYGPYAHKGILKMLTRPFKHPWEQLSRDRCLKARTSGPSSPDPRLPLNPMELPQTTSKGDLDISDHESTCEPINKRSLKGLKNLSH